LLSPKSAPSNWKDPVKIAQYEADSRVRQLEEAAKKPLTGRLQAIAMVAQGQIQDANQGSLLEQIRRFEYVAVIEAGLFKSLVIADQIDRFNTLGGHGWIVTSARSGHPYLMAGTHVQPGYTHPVIFDPIHAITGSTAEESNIPELVAERFNVKVKGKTVAERRAWLAFELCRRLGVS
jgi:hypothetical protein